MKLNVVTSSNETAIAALAATEREPFRLAEVKRDLLDSVTRRTHQTAVANFGYINRIEIDDEIGPVPPTYMAKARDLIVAGRRHPVGRKASQIPMGRLLWDHADAKAGTDPKNEAAAVHIVLGLPDLPQERWQDYATDFIDQELTSLGMVVDYAIHAVSDANGGWLVTPHVHCLATSRRWKPDQQRGRRMKQWLASKAQIEALENAWLTRTGLKRRPIVRA
jgi:MobA/MobL family